MIEYFLIFTIEVLICSILFICSLLLAYPHYSFPPVLSIVLRTKFTYVKIHRFLSPESRLQVVSQIGRIYPALHSEYSPQNFLGYTASYLTAAITACLFVVGSLYDFMLKQDLPDASIEGQTHWCNSFLPEVSAPAQGS